MGSNLSYVPIKETKHIPSHLRNNLSTMGSPLHCPSLSWPPAQPLMCWATLGMSELPLPQHESLRGGPDDLKIPPLLEVPKRRKSPVLLVMQAFFPHPHPFLPDAGVLLCLHTPSGTQHPSPVGGLASFLSCPWSRPRGEGCDLPLSPRVLDCEPSLGTLPRPVPGDIARAAS